MVQADPAEFVRLGQVGQGQRFKHPQLLVERVAEVAYPRVGHQGLATTAKKSIQKRQVGTVVQHVGDQDQVEAVVLGEEVVAVAQLHTVQCGIRAAGLQGQWVQVAGHHLPGTRAGGSDAGNAGPGAKVQHPLAGHPFRALGQVTGHGQATGPAEAPVGRVFQNAPGFVAAEGAVHVLVVDQPQFQGAAGQFADDQPRFTDQAAECLLQGERCHSGRLLET